MRDLILPVRAGELEQLTSGECVRLFGSVATMRDAAHRIILDIGRVPFDMQTVPVFYAGPSPAPPGRPCGACGPTTSARMEPFIPAMLGMGMKIAIGKGDMSTATRTLFAEHGAVYLAATGGGGALAASRVRTRRVIALDHLGPEAVSILELDGFPVFVAWDLHNGNIYNIHRR